MRQGHLSVFLVAFVFLAIPFAGAQARADEDTAIDVIHSDLPLFGGSAEEIWPRGFSSDNTIGCASRVQFGDWAFRETGAEGDSPTQWYRIRNYGAFHCFALVATSDERGELEGAEPRPSYFVLLGTVHAGSETELWAIQIGTRPGSDYVLLSRSRVQGSIRTFNVLQTQCPRANVRDGGVREALLTRYCAINSQAELQRLARRMAPRRPLGTLSLVEENDTNDNNASN